MSRRVAQTSVNYAVDQETWSDSEQSTQPQPRPAKSQRMATERVRKRPRAAEPLASATTTTKASKTSPIGDSKRAKIEEVPATQPADDSVDEFDLPQSDTRAMSTPTTATKRHADGAAPKTRTASESASKPRAKRGRKPKEVKIEVPETQVEHPEEGMQASSHFSRTTRDRKRPRPVKGNTIPTTDNDGDVLDHEMEEKQPKNMQDTSLERARGSRPEHPSNPDPDVNGADAQRKLQQVTKRFDALEVRFAKLKDVGVTEAQANYEELKRRTDERQKASEALISNLRTELAVQAAQAAEVAEQRSEIADLSALSEKLKSENQSLEASLNSSRAETRALEAKLAAERSASEQRAVPPSAVKNRINARQLPPGAGAADAHKLALKEQLYGDLTGLIIRDVKRREDEDGNMDVFDCIQTGRNGTLRFHLAVPNPQPAGVAFGDVDLEYTPLLDPSNDRLLIDILPDYLTVEILFPQREAQRFYGRINEFIMKSRPAPPEAQEANGITDE